MLYMDGKEVDLKTLVNKKIKGTYSEPVIGKDENRLIEFEGTATELVKHSFWGECFKIDNDTAFILPIEISHAFLNKQWKELKFNFAGTFGP